MPKATTYMTEAIILHKRDWRQYDRTYLILTPDGKKEIKAIGCRRSKSKLVGRIEPWLHSDLLLVHGKVMDIMADSQPRGQWPALKGYLPAYICAASYTELIDQLVPLGDPSEETFAAALRRFEELEALAAKDRASGSSSKGEWRAWWLSASDELLRLAGLAGSEEDAAADLDAAHWYLTSVLEQPLQTFPLVRAIL